LGGSAAAIALFALGCREDTIAAPRRFIPGLISRSSAPSTSYNYYRTITIDHTKVSGTQTNFTVCVAGTVASLATVANGGRVVSSNGYDIAFFSDAAFTIPLAFERTLYTASTGKHAFWVKVPTLSSTTDTVIYMLYGGSSVTTDQQDKVNAWDANYVEVHNFGDGSSFDGSDSTAAGRALTNHGATVTSDGIDGAIVPGTVGSAERIASSPPFTGFGINATIETLFNPTETTTTAVMISINSQSSPSIIFEVTKRPNGVLRCTFGNGAGGSFVHTDSTAQYAANVTNYGAAVFAGNANRSVYVNGAAAVQNTTTIPDNSVPDTTVVGCRYLAGSRTYFVPGSIGQVRFSNIVRTAGWVTTADASTRGIASFYVVGGETSKTPSPYANAATDGTDPGCNIALKNAQTVIAKSGDRRGATRTLYAGTFEGAAFPAVYNDMTYPTPFGTVRNVTAGSATSLQNAINAAVVGDEIVIPAGVANKIIGSFTLPAKAGADQTPGGNNVVIIRTSNIASMPYGVRVVGANQATRTGLTPTNAANFAYIQASGLNPAFNSNNVAGHGYRFVGLDIGADPAMTGPGQQISRIMRLGDGNPAQNSDALVPKNIVIDRCYIHSTGSLQEMLHAVDFQVGNSIIVDSDISDVKNSGGGDCQAVVCYNSNGRNSYINSYFEATDECLADGGSDNRVGSLVDMEHRWCVFGKQDSWNPAHPSYAGKLWSIKLSAEIKKGQRSLWEGCWFIGCWTGNQDGDAINIKNEYNEVGGAHTSDVILRYCDLEKLDNGFRMAGSTYAPDRFAVRRVAIAHCVGVEIGTGYYGSGTHGEAFESAAVEGFHAVHNTMFAARICHYLLPGGVGDTDGKTNGFVARDNIYGPVTFDHFRGGGTPDGKSSIDTWAPGGLVHGNIIVGANSANYTGTDLSGNFFPANNTAVGFKNYAAGDYSLAH
jgi:hypothetical protein